MNRTRKFRGFEAMLCAAALGAIQLTHGNDGGSGQGGPLIPPKTEPVKKWYKLLKKYKDQEVGAKIEMTETDATVLIEAKYVEELKEDPANDLVTKVAKELTTALQKTVTDTASQIVDHVRRQITTPSPSGRKTPLSIEVNDPRNEQNQWGYGSFGEFSRDILTASKKAPEYTEKMRSLLEQTHSKSVSGMSTLVGEDGGITIPPAFSAAIFERAYNASSLLPRVDQYTVTNNSMAFLVNQETSRATGSRWGGVRAYWLNEGGQYTGTKPKLGEMRLTLKKLTIMAFATNELLSDSPWALETYLQRIASSELDFMLSDAIINGNGAGVPKGILASTSPKVTQAAVSGQGSGTVTATNISAMWSRMYAPSRANAVWFINQEVEPQLDKLALSIGSGGSTWPLYLPPGGLADAPFGRLKGRPVVPIEYCAALGTEGDIILADLSQYCAITKGGLMSAMSMHLRFDFDEMAFKFSYRFDGQPWWPTALTPYKGSNTQSCFVTLSSSRT